MRAGALSLLLALGQLSAMGNAGAAEDFETWPGATYDTSVPALAPVTGHGFGEAITEPADLVRYLEALASAAPERTRLVEYARSWEGRPLHYLLITSPANATRLDAIRAGMQRLADPRGVSPAERQRLVAELPVVVWLAHGVHGDEISSSDAALLTAYHLLADQGDDTASLLNDTVVVIDPSQNPDGRARFVHHHRSVAGPVPQPSPIAAERAQAWPGGRTNHYLFDMNRDWFALTQPEVRGRVRAFLEYYPLVYVDLHEMGTDASYYFPPPAVPYNPYLTETQHAMLTVLGQGTAAAFDRFGFRYYTREIFDAYYPGYGDTWPGLQGAAGMTFEMASARGLLGQRTDGSLVSYRDGVHRHFVASLATVRTAAVQRRRLLEDFVALRSRSVDDTAYVLSRDPDPGRTDKLAGLLMTQGVEVRRMPEGGRLCGMQVPGGSYVVSADQPAGRLAATLLAAESPAEAAFWEEQQRRADKRLPVEIYDVVAWSLPLLFDVPVASCRASVGRYPVVEGEPGEPPAAPAQAAVAYLVRWGTQSAARFLAGALARDLRVEVATRSFSRRGTRYPRGTLILRRSANEPALAQRVRELAAATGAPVTAADESWVDMGIDLGSERVRSVPAPRVALAWDEPTVATSAGAWRYLLERKLEYPVAPVRVRDLGSRWLDQFQLLVLPDGDYEALDEDTRANLERWVRRGGTLVAVAGAMDYLTAAELLSSRPELRASEDDGDGGGSDVRGDPDTGGEAGGRRGGTGGGTGKDEPPGPVPGTLLATPDDYRAAVRPEKEPPQEVPGVLVKGAVDPDHWLSAGLPPELPFMVSGSRIFTPLQLDKGTNVVSFVAAESLVAGGHLWKDVGRQLARKPAVLVQPHDLGQIVAFVVDPAFRGMMDGLDVLVANAVFFGPAVAQPIPPPPPLPAR